MDDNRQFLMRQILSSPWFRYSLFATLAALALILIPIAPIATFGGLLLLIFLPGGQLTRRLELTEGVWTFKNIALSTALGLVTSPIVIYWSSLLFGFNRWTVLIVFTLYILAMAAWVSYRPPDMGDEPPPIDLDGASLWTRLVIVLLMGITAVGVYLAYFELETPQGYYPVQMEDWQKHYGVAFALRYTGVPPTSMFFYGMFPDEPLVYYYFLHLNGATLDLLQSGPPFLHQTFVTVIVLASLSFSSIFFLLAQRLFQNRAAAVWSLAFATVIGGLDVIPILHRTIEKYRANFPDGPIPIGVYLPREHIDNWVSALSLRLNTFYAHHVWVPQHLTALTIVCLGCLLYLAIKDRRKLLIIMPLLLFSLLGHSTWIAVIVAAALFLFALWQIGTTYRHQGFDDARQLFFGYALVAVAFIAVASPFIAGLIGPNAPKSGIAFVIPTLDSWAILRPFQTAFGNAVWARVLDLPLHFFIEMGALLVAGLGGLVLSFQRSAFSGQQLAVSGQRLAVSRQQVAVSGQQVAVSGQQLAVSGQQLAVSRQQLAVSGQRSAISDQHEPANLQSPVSSLQSPISPSPHLPISNSLLPFFAILLVIGFVMVSFFASGRGWSEIGLTLNNDLGLRALMPGQLVLALFAGYFMVRLFEAAWARPVKIGVIGLMLLLIAVGMLNPAWEFVAMDLAKYWSEPQLTTEVYQTLRALPEVTVPQEKVLPVVQHRLHRNASRFQLSLGSRPIGFSTGEAVVFHPEVRDIALAHELSQQAFDNGLPVWSYQMFQNLGADYIFVGPAERESMRHPEKYAHEQYFQPVFAQGDFEIYQVNPPTYSTDQPQATFDKGAIEFLGHFIDPQAQFPGESSDNVGGYGFVTAWRLADATDKNYTVFVHLVDDDGNIIAQADHQLWAWDVKTEGPTSTWTPQLIHLDITPVPESALAVDSNLTIRLGLWLPDTGEQFVVETPSLPVDPNGRLIAGDLESLISP